jgi:thioredoxin-like negative regulator of GroEL
MRPTIHHRKRPARGRCGDALLAALACAVLAVCLATPAQARDKPLDAKLQRLDGTKVTLAELRGTPVLLDLWATWCLPCREQAEILRGMEAQLAERGVHVFAVNVAEEESLVATFLGREPSHYPVLLDRRQTIATRLQLGELPALVLLAPDGTVAGSVLGLSRSEQVLDLLGKLAPVAGQPAAGSAPEG